MDLSTQPQVYKEEGCVGVLRGGHGRGDVIDLTGLHVPRKKERDSDGWIETEIQQRKGPLDRQIDQEREDCREASDR